MNDEDDIARAGRARAGHPFLNTRQAARYLGLASRQLERMRANGMGPAFRRHTRFIQYHIDDLIAWSEAKRSESGHD